MGLFDSGAGGVSVLREAVRLFPAERYLYYGDSRNAPYGEKDEGEILRLTQDAVGKLLAQGVKAVVIACNTASSVAAAPLRERLRVPVIAMEPALKPAHLHRRSGCVLVLATAATLRLPKFCALMDAWGEGAVPVPAPALVRLVESGVTDGPAVRAELERLAPAAAGARVDAVVLGCTHFVFLRRAVEGFFPCARVVDGNEGTVRQMGRVLAARGMLRGEGTGGVTLLSSGGEEALALYRRLLHTPG